MRNVQVSSWIAGMVFAIGCGHAAMAQKPLELRYGHMNPPTSAAGLQAQWLAEEIAKQTGSQINLKVYPSSQLGKLQELAEAVSTGTIALSHNTAAGFGALYEPFAALDTPYLYRDVAHLMKVVDVDSPVMKKLSAGLSKSAGVRVLYAYYFGTRQLTTTNKAVYQPSDLGGLKIRAIPFPIYLATVTGMGAVPVPVDFAELPTALATGQVAGQENPFNVIHTSKMFETQSYLMLTGHIMGAQYIVINEGVWKGLSEQQRTAVTKAANIVRERATKYVLDQEAADLESLKKAGMKVIGPAEGLKLDAFKASVATTINKDFGAKYGDLYKEISAIK